MIQGGTNEHQVFAINDTHESSRSIEKQRNLNRMYSLDFSTHLLLDHSNTHRRNARPAPRFRLVSILQHNEKVSNAQELDITD
jgi:hypothetical protein